MVRNFYIFFICLLNYGVLTEKLLIRKKRYPVAVSEGRTDTIIHVNCSITNCPPDSRSQVYCNGPIISTTWYFGTQKTCPGDIMRFPADTILENFQKLPKGESITKEQFLDFCQKNFDAGSYLETVIPNDWTPKPPNLAKIKDEKLQDFALKLNERWKHLGRKFKSDVFEKPHLYPVYPIKNAFIVPGGDFKIYFYWDTFWILKGLLFSGMESSALNILKNFGELITDVLGYIPNDGAISAAGSSQPPVFTQMVWDYVQKAEKGKFVGKEKHVEEVLQILVPALDKEFEWWISNRSVQVISPTKTKHTMFRYMAKSNCPRPESFNDDIEKAVKSGRPNETVWRDIISTCESGWDFSTRWFAYSGPNKDKSPSIRTTQIIPVDLNVFLCKNAQILSLFHQKLGNEDRVKFYQDWRNQLIDAVEKVFWNESSGIWFDYDNQYSIQRDRFYTSNVFPLYAECYPQKKTENFTKVLQYLQKEKVLDYPGGIPISTGPIGEQWDFPNAWPPAVHLFIESLRLTNHKQLLQIAFDTAQKWINTNYRGLMNPIPGKEPGMWEKYDVRYDDGRPGTGGEYPVQQGFGWTNGAVLDLLLTYGDRLAAPNTVPISTTSKSSPNLIVVIVCCSVVIIVILGFLIGYGLSKRKSLVRQRSTDDIQETVEVDSLLNNEH